MSRIGFIANKRVLAFTLAEVLITLGIIGVVAAITIPTLMNNIQKKDTYVAFEKALSIISQAAAQIRLDNGGSFSGLITSTNSDFANLFKPYLKVVKSCNNSSDSENCYVKNTDNFHNLNGQDYGGIANIAQQYAKIVTADGFVYMFNFNGVSDCSATNYIRAGEGEFCGVVSVDINGVKLPNTVGKDVFNISVNKYNVTPYWNMGFPITTLCDPATTNIWNGSNCGALMIRDGGITYY